MQPFRRIVRTVATWALICALACAPTLAQDIKVGPPSLPLSAANGGTADSGSAWTAFTPVPTASAGTFTTVSSAGAYKVLGKSVWFRIVITITTVGTASGSMIFALPIGTAAGTTTFVCRDQITSGKTGTGLIVSGTTNATNILDSVSVTMIAAGVQLACAGMYEQT